MGNCQDSNNIINNQNEISSQQFQDSQNQQNNNNELQVEGVTWIKDSHGLFDYETTHTIKTQLNINQSGRIVRKDNQILFQREDQIQNENEEILLTLTKDNSGVFWVKQHQKDQDEIYNQWTVVKCIPNELGYMLQQNDIMKMGRVEFRIKELVLDKLQQKRQLLQNLNEKRSINLLDIDNTDVLTDFEYTQNQENNNNNNRQSRNLINLQQQSNAKTCDIQQMISQEELPENQNSNIINNNADQQQIDDQNRMCRICLSEETNDNLLVNPCKCQGTMKYIHLKCQLTWINSKMQLSHKHVNNKTLIYIPKQFECELCKNKYPCKFQSEGQEFDLQEIAKPKVGPYALIEVMQTNSKIQNPIGCYIITFKKNKTQKLHIGRSHESELRITDISVSRQHSCLHWNGERLYIQDKESKFGSLVQVKEEIALTRDLDGISLQCGRTTVQFRFRNNDSGCQFFKSCLNQIQSTQTDENISQNNEQN